MPSDEQAPLTMRDIGKRGGEACRDRHGHEHYVQAGRKGGQRVKEMLEKAKQAEDAERHA